MDQQRLADGGARVQVQQGDSYIRGGVGASDHGVEGYDADAEQALAMLHTRDIRKQHAHLRLQKSCALVVVHERNTPLATNTLVRELISVDEQFKELFEHVRWRLPRGRSIWWLEA